MAREKIGEIYLCVVFLRRQLRAHSILRNSRLGIVRALFSRREQLDVPALCKQPAGDREAAGGVADHECRFETLSAVLVLLLHGLASLTHAKHSDLEEDRADDLVDENNRYDGSLELATEQGEGVRHLRSKTERHSRLCEEGHPHVHVELALDGPAARGVETEDCSNEDRNCAEDGNDNRKTKRLQDDRQVEREPDVCEEEEEDVRTGAREHGMEVVEVLRVVSAHEARGDRH
mmetsp:Transcript_20412/g.51866  ORF Transcript_20412/g.51866 Transcript_20412/m.51866 type:complete len:233 (+) Transcript_20412:1186-1884(+)